MHDDSAIWRDPGSADRLEGTRFDAVRWFDELDSTNKYVLAQAEAGAPEGLVAVADHQTAGRGRLDRRWLAPPGTSLLVSVLLRPAVATEHWHLVTVAASLAVADALEKLAGIRVGLKWPNDLVVDDRKIAGVLAESSLGGPGGPALVVGLGCNVDWHEMPDELRDLATACNAVSDRPVDREDLLVEFLRSFEVMYAGLGDGAARERLRQRERQHSTTLGRRVRVEQPDGVVVGTAVDLTTQGALVVDCGAGRKVFAVADVVHLRPDSSPEAGEVSPRPRT